MLQRIGKMNINIFVPEITFQTIWAICLDLHPNLETLNMKDVIALPRKSLDPLILLEILKANHASSEAHISILFQVDDRLDFAEILVILVPDLLEAWWQSVLRILRNNVLFILNIVNNASIHQEYSELMQRSHEFLSSVDFFLHID